MEHAKWVEKILGDDFFDNLQKTEIYKERTKTNLDSEEIAIAYKIVPRAVLKFLTDNLKSLAVGQNLALNLLPIGINGQLLVNKLSTDVYSGDITAEGRRVYDYQYRSIPGIGIILLTTFEMYDFKEIEEKEEKVEVSHEQEFDYFTHINEIIEEKLKLNKLISEVVDRKLSEKEALDRLVTSKLAEIFLQPKVEPVMEVKEEFKMEKPSIRDFLKRKAEKREQNVHFLKSDINCPDCGTKLYKKEEEVIKGCICYGFGPEEDAREVKICKNEKDINLKFNGDWDKDSINKLVSLIRKG